jgi:hypothetical protein
MKEYIGESIQSLDSEADVSKTQLTSGIAIGIVERYSVIRCPSSMGFVPKAKRHISS